MTKLTAKDIANSWQGKFHFNKETENSPGLRSPQIGALHALMAHVEDGEDSAIIVMPTGTGKTETMLAFLIANCCHKVFVIVPSDALRTQTAKKFRTLGLLPKLNVVPSDINFPIVETIREGLEDDEWKQKIDNSNVIITTMSLAARISPAVRKYLKENISYLFVDEAHHSKAETWNEFINIFSPNRVLMFTATPFRNDGQKLNGKIVFKFSLKKAQEQHYYEKINNYQIMRYSLEDADRAIAEKAISILRKDLENGYDHIVMARCKNISRAKEVFEVYKKYSDYSPILVYSGMKNSNGVLKEIKEKRHRIIVCVNMLGEGYDLPQLKIAAIHDEKQSLAVTLQFIGRFTRTSSTKLGIASFITNIAYPPIAAEINSLYQTDADWNYILPRLNDDESNNQRSISEFLSDFKGDLGNEISLEDIRPALSAEIYTTTSTTTSFSNWKSCLNNISKDDLVLHTISNNTLIVVIGKKANVLWGDTKTVQNLNWDIIVVYFDAQYKRIYLNSTIKIKGESFLKHMFSNPLKIQNDKLFRVFSNVRRLRLFNVGARLPQGKDISFQSYYGRSVEDGINLLEQGKLLKNNLFGIGFKNGAKVSIGCSTKGKVWSRERADLLHYQEWCRDIGKIIYDETIDPNVVLQNTLSFEVLSKFPKAYPISIDWHPDVYEHYVQQVVFENGIFSFDEIDISVDPSTTVGDNVIVNFVAGVNQSRYKLEIQDKKVKYSLLSGKPIRFLHGNSELSLEDFLSESPMTIYYADNSISYGVNLCRPKPHADEIPEELISTFSWDNIDLSKESQRSAPYRKDSIQYYMVQQIIGDYDYLIDDDGSGEIADLVAINNSENTIEVTLYHLKFAIGGTVSQKIDNLYQVCGQAQKSIRWKYVCGNKVFEHLLKRNEQKIKNNKSSSLLKGTIKDITKLKEEASNRKEICYHVVIVQPGMSKSNCTHEMKILLGNTVQVLHEMANIDCRVICSE